MKRSEMGMILKVFGVVVIVLGVISSLVLGFGMTHGSEVIDDLMGYMIEPEITYDFTKAIFGIFASVIFGLIILGIGEIICILDENRENYRRLCKRFGVNPVDNIYNSRRKNRHHNVQQNTYVNPNANMNGSMNPNGNVNPNGNMMPEGNVNPNGNGNPNGNVMPEFNENQNRYVSPELSENQNLNQEESQQEVLNTNQDGILDGSVNQDTVSNLDENSNTGEY